MTSLQVHVATIRGAAGPAAGARATWHDEAPPAERAELRQLDVDLLQPGRYQPRRRFAEETIAELAASIRAEGVLQPIVVRALPGTLPQRYEIIAGERRWRAAQLAGLAQIPAVVRVADDRAALVQALIENIQREDLNPVEEARGVQRLIDELGLTHEEAAMRLGRSRDAVTHLLRILKLDADVLRQVEAGALSLGHAKLLASQPAAWQRFLAREVAQQGLTVRQLERRVRTLSTKIEEQRRDVQRNGDVVRLEQRVSELTGTTTQVEYSPGKRRGRIAFSFHSLEELQGLLERLGYTDD
jgi:ParB family transcriptional regulator, chromosome partitioning protein